MLVRNSFSMSRRRILFGSVAVLGMLAAPSAISAMLTRPMEKLKRHAPRALAQPISLLRNIAVADAPNDFTEDEQIIVSRLVAIMIPSGGTPGAQEAGSTLFVIDSLQKRGATAVASIKQGLSAIDGISQQQFGQDFAAISDVDAQQLAKLVARDPQLVTLWSAIRSLAVLHFYAQPMAYELLGMPGPNIDQGGFPDGHRPVCN